MSPLQNIPFLASSANNTSLLALSSQRVEVLKNDRLVLYAGANLPSDEAIAAYSPGLSAWPAMGPSFDKEQPDTGLISALEVAIAQQINRLFASVWAETRLPNCTTANLAVFHAFSRPGDLLLAPAAAHGGHLSQRKGGTPELAGLQVEDLPYDPTNNCLDTLAAVAMIARRKPKLVMLGRSVMLKADDIEPVVESARRVGARTIFDASHVLGLIAGGMFPNPLSLGVDIMTSSTYKTLPGRPHSIIAGSNADDRIILSNVIENRLIANCDAGCLPSLLVTLEQAEQHGADYARRVCQNTAIMAATLRQAGYPIIAAQPFETATHQLLLPMSANQSARETVNLMEKQGILVGTCADPTATGQFALRVGTQFMTRLGVDEPGFSCIAKRLSSLLDITSDNRLQMRSRAL